jgi:hypothetical protein
MPAGGDQVSALVLIETSPLMTVDSGAGNRRPIVTRLQTVLDFAAVTAEKQLQPFTRHDTVGRLSSIGYEQDYKEFERRNDKFLSSLPNLNSLIDLTFDRLLKEAPPLDTVVFFLGNEAVEEFGEVGACGKRLWHWCTEDCPRDV